MSLPAQAIVKEFPNPVLTAFVEYAILFVKEFSMFR